LTHVRLVVDHTRPIAKISKVKDLTLILLIIVLSLPVYRFHLLSKKHLNRSFCYIFTHSQTFNEMFIVSGKSRCCSGTFTNVLYIATNKEYLIKSQIILDFRLSIPSAILSEIFIQIG